MNYDINRQLPGYLCNIYPIPYTMSWKLPVNTFYDSVCEVQG